MTQTAKGHPYWNQESHINNANDPKTSHAGEWLPLLGDRGPVGNVTQEDENTVVVAEKQLYCDKQL